ncbi:MAG: phosphoenolpyruvate--protein phosphotransferase [Planctomycetes bacterium TMED75]|nr:phosphoenolpyruvate--protein phosphotransferase [Planctomycetaceae bacterium]OUU96136.1 MAG: phosphoenolpyruvate--protein phosphotransferase [Planctomycetes bacterium TMED75]
METIQGIPVSSGIAIGRAFVLDAVERYVPERRIRPEDVENEIERLWLAIGGALDELTALRTKTEEELGADPAKILDFHIGILQDPTLMTPVQDRIRDGLVNAERAVAERFEQLAQQFRTMGSAVFRQKANDIIDLDRRVLGRLLGQTDDRLSEIDGAVVLVAHELTPSQAASIDRSKILAIATDAGGRTSHTSIIARALQIPSVVGCHALTNTTQDGDKVIIDGEQGVVLVRPESATVESYTERQTAQRAKRLELRSFSELEPVTLDGTRIKLLGNIEFPEEATTTLENGGDGVGLYRTEFLWLTRNHAPSEEEQFEAYRKALELLNGLPLTIRTLDLGADKYTQQQSEEPERNPFLGLRSIRYCLQNLPMFKTQLRAIVRASAFGPMKIMFPLVSTVMELRQTKMLLRDVCEELEEESIPFDRDLETGMMVEVPSAALMAKVFATEVSFFSIGTNDLIQYTLAVDRGNERVANLYTGAHPAVLQLIKSVVRAARRRSVEVSICGEIAAEPIYTMLLIGLGIRTLSVVPSQIPYIKRVVRSVDIERCERVARKIGTFDSERQVLNCLRDELRKVNPESLTDSSGDA